MGTLSKKTLTTVLSAKAATGYSSNIDIRDFKNTDVFIGTTGNANCTIKCLASGVDNTGDIDFTAASSPTNPWDYQELIRLDDSTSRIVGATGLALTGTDSNHWYKVNCDNQSFICFQVSAYAAGAITVKLCSRNSF